MLCWGTDMDTMKKWKILEITNKHSCQMQPNRGKARVNAINGNRTRDRKLQTNMQVTLTKSNSYRNQLFREGLNKTFFKSQKGYFK